MDAAPDPVARARERFAVRDHHGAVLLLQQAVTEGLAYADAFNLLGLSLALVGRQAEALEAFDRALALNGRYVEAHLNRAVLLNELGRFDEAHESFAAAATLGRADTTGFPAMVANRLANAHLRLGHDYRAAGAVEEAITQYRRALELRPQFADVRLALGRALVEAGRYDDASAALDAVLESRPGWLDAMLLSGLAAYLAGDLDGADAVWTEASERHREEPRIEIYRAMLARRRAAAE
ncbi:MAG TPA: tetratricopeptide repeat protein [Gemmatimonadaceae bacterium]|nr:tetratricopeptide repeat protein [Gemmatimonadaceae bacterium]